MLLVGVLPEVFQYPPGPLNVIEALRLFISTPLDLFYDILAKLLLSRKEGIER